MFPKNSWYAACAETELGSGPLGRRVCGESMVFFRGSDGRAVGLEDLCPHRGAPLSLGRVCEGRLVCGYHGLELSCDGKPLAMPRQRVRGFPAVRRYPALERYGFVWVWPGQPERADPARLPDLAWAEDPEWTHGGGVYHVRCDYRLWYFWGLARNFKVHDAALTESIRADQGNVFLEDVAMLEAQQRNLCARPQFEPLSLNTDAGGVQARRIIDRLLAEEASVP